MNAQPRRSRAKEGTLCAKCEHLNPSNRSECERCGSHLYLACKDCGERNPRARSRCSGCGRRLHRSMLSRLQGRLFRRGPKVTLLQIVLALAAIFAAYRVIVRIAEYDPPPPP